MRRKPFLALSANRLAATLGGAAVVAALVQLLLGSSPVVVFIALITIAAGLFGFVALGACNFCSWVALFYALGNVLIALYAKTAMGQPLDSNLYAPIGSFSCLAVSSIGLLTALLLVRRVRVGRPLLPQTTSPQFLEFLSWCCFGLGAFFWALNRWFQGPSGSGFDGISLFRNLFLMAVIARTAMLLGRSQYRRAFDGRLGLIMGLSAVLGLIDNSKTMAALPIVSHFATVLFYRRGLSLRAIATLVIGSLAFAIVVAPMVHALRALGQQELTLDQRIKLLSSNAAAVLETPQRLNRIQRLAATQFQHGYYSYFGDNGAGQMLLGRYASVQQIDPVIAEVNNQGAIGGAATWPALVRLVPSFVYPDKPQYTEAYKTLVHYHLVDPAGGKFPTLPLAGQAYATYGFLGVLVIPFTTFFGFLLIVKKLGWHLCRNVYAIFFFCDFVIVYVGQGDFGQYAGASLRAFPLFAIMFFLIDRCYRIRVGRRAYQSYQRIPHAE